MRCDGDLELDRLDLYSINSLAVVKSTINLLCLFIIVDIACMNLVLVLHKHIARSRTYSTTHVHV
jgi:hypothetical protein